MAKTKTPFLSLGAKGTVGNSLTSQSQSGTTMLRSKPTPTYTRTLPQQYQRWLYEDYAYLWRQQSEAVRRAYAADGSRFHLTGYQYWMKYQLTNLPDIVGRWHLDERSDNIVPDISKNQIDGILIGASYTPCLISDGLKFDGLNDEVRLGLPSVLTNPTAKSVFLFFKASPFTGTWRKLYYGSYWHPPYGDMIALASTSNTLYIYARDTAGVAKGWNAAFTPNVWHSAAYTWDGTTFQAYYDGATFGPQRAFSGPMACSGRQHALGSGFVYYYYDGYLDHVIIYNRALDPSEITRHSQRSYPA